MISKLIAWCVDNRFLVLTISVIVTAIGIWSTATIPVDAMPDLSDVQVIIHTKWPGRDPQTIEDQITYPLATAMLAVPGVADVRGASMNGDSFVYVIFDDSTDPYWARSRVLEYLNQVQGQLLAGVTPSLGPDASGLGWVFMYTLEDTQNRYDLGELRAIQDWYVRYQLTAVPGVAEVATVGGAVRQYQIAVDPRRLLLYNISLKQVVAAIKDSNLDVGGRVIEVTETEQMIRGRGYIRGVHDLEKIVLTATDDGTPVSVKDVATIQIGPDMKRGIAEKNGKGNVVAGIVVMRYGENALEVINAVKEKIRQLEPGLPAGVVVRTGYDRSGLIHRSISTLKVTLAEELAITTLICLMFLFHVRSALVAAIVLPLGILMAFIVMNLIGVGANIMSLAGIAVAVGTMVDASVVMVENLHKHKESASPDESHWELVKRSAQEVGPGLFASLLVVTVSFLPVFVLQGQAGRLFKPLAFTKTFSMAAAAIIAVTLIPVLLGFFVRGRLKPENKNPLNRLMIWIYLPFLRFALRHKIISILIAVGILAVTLVPLGKLGSEFMPPLREGDILYMPTTVPGLSVTEAQRTLQMQDAMLSRFPEVKSVLGKMGRSTTPTDPAPLNMVETHIMLREKRDWPLRLIQKGYIRKISRRMLADLSAGDFLTTAGNKLDPTTISDQTEGKARWEVNRITREQLVTCLRVEIPKLRKRLETRRKQMLADGKTVGSRFDEQDTEDHWAADLLRRKMTQIRTALPTRIIEQTARALVDILISQAGLSEDRKQAAVRHLTDGWKTRISAAALPMVRTTFNELTKHEMQRTLTIPGMPNWWLMPIETRIGMLATGMRGQVGLKLYGTDLTRLAEVSVKLEEVLRRVPGTASVIAERVLGGHYLDIEVDRDECARYNLKVGDVQRVIESAIGGMNIGTTVEGRFRFPINVRYPPELRDDPEKLKRILVAAPNGVQIPLGLLARIKFNDGPPVIKSESGLLVVNIPVALDPKVDIGGYVERAQAEIERALASGELKMPPGYYTKWSGQYEFMQQVKKRLKIIVPITLALIFILIFWNMGNVTETLITMGTLPFALIGGVWGMYWLGYNWSVAVAIGFIALAGLAAETGIIMHVYLDLAYRKHREEKGRALTPSELEEAVIDGAVLRVRPKLMTVLTDFLALLPILWATTAGAGPMKRIAISVIGGVITSAIHTLILIPVYYALYKRWEQWRLTATDGEELHTPLDASHPSGDRQPRTK